MGKKATEAEMREVLARALAEGDQESLDYAPDTTLSDAWRNDPDLRAHARRKADALLEALAEAGVSLRVSSSAKVHAAVEDMMTIPPRHAYGLDEMV